MTDVEDEEPENHPRLIQRRSIRVIAGVVVALGLLALGAFGGALITERRRDAARPTTTATTAPQDTQAASHGAHGTGPTASAAPGASPADADVEVTLTPEALQRAGIKVAAVEKRSMSGMLMVPGTVTSNAYRDTKVNALVGGVVRQVGVELGAGVRRGQTLAVIFSSELADAQMKYLSMRASFQADHQKLERTRKLVELGAASRQELEEVTAVHEAHATELAAAGQRLLLLGLTAEQTAGLTDASQVVSEISVPAPAEGVVIARSVNPGQVVAAGQELFIVTDLGTVWIIGDLYEKDFARVTVGTPARIVVPAVANRPLHGRVAYIDPRVDPATRTAKVRVEVPNRESTLRLGMFVELTFETGSAGARAVVPRAAVQSIGSRTVVYVATEDEGRFVERTIQLGAAAGDAVEVVGGLKPGERVVTDGSFYLRAEAGRQRAGS
jgi:RND family efflux transporter MFP subunit